MPDSIDTLNISNRMGEMILHEYFNNCVGKEYNPYNFLLGIKRISDSASSGEIVWKYKDDSGDLELLTYH